MNNISPVPKAFEFPYAESVGLQPIDDREPCGPSLEYDHEYAVLLARMMPRIDAQYGTFVGLPEAPNWPEIERDCQRLLLRTKDINLLVWLCRARTRLGQASGLLEGLSLLCAVLQAWPDAVHPQLVIEGERDPVVRANALAGLVDPEGLLGDVFDIVVASNTAMRLAVRDVERAFAIPRMPESRAPEAVAQQLADLRNAAQGDTQSPLMLLAQAARFARAIEEWAKNRLRDHSPPLHALTRVLELFIDPQLQREAVGSGPTAANDLAEPRAAADTTTGGRTRADVLRNIRAAREWFEAHEPSSPVAVLLKQSEKMVGKRFSQVVDVIPLELLQRWETEDGQTDAARGGRT